MFPYIISGDVVSLVIDNKPYTIDPYHVHFLDIKESIKNGDWENVKKMAMVSIVDTINVNGLIVDTSNGTVKYKDYQLPNVLIIKILEMVKHKFDLNHLLKFIDNLMLNPSYKTIQELYSFLEVGKLPITEDGCFLAYKKVNADYTSIHDSKTMNAIGTYVRMDRNLVDDDSSSTCSNGLHFCSYDYLQHFGSSNPSEYKVLIVKVAPQNVVSIPKDFNDTKGRACEYYILSETDHVKMDKPYVDTSPYYDYDEDDDSFIDEYDLGYEHGLNGEDDDYDGNYSRYGEGYADGYSDGLDRFKKRNNIKEILAEDDDFTEELSEHDKNGMNSSMEKKYWQKIMILPKNYLNMVKNGMNSSMDEPIITLKHNNYYECKNGKMVQVFHYMNDTSKIFIDNNSFLRDQSGTCISKVDFSQQLNEWQIIKDCTASEKPNDGLKEYTKTIKEFLESEPTDDYVHDYNLGYKHGRKKLVNVLDTDGYSAGHSDGRNHRNKRKFD